jgi:hypothetical protein
MKTETVLIIGGVLAGLGVFAYLTLRNYQNKVAVAAVPVNTSSAPSNTLLQTSGLLLSTNLSEDISSLSSLFGGSNSDSSDDSGQGD